MENEYEITANVVFPVWAETEEEAREKARWEFRLGWIDIEDVELVTEDD